MKHPNGPNGFGTRSRELAGKDGGETRTVRIASTRGENSMLKDGADKLCETLGLPSTVSAGLQVFPVKAQNSDLMVNDSFVYRLNEVVMVYGETLKEVVQEKMGDGIVSAIDFTLDVEKVEDPKGDRVKITLNGKFLPYKRW